MMTPLADWIRRRHALEAGVADHLLQESRRLAARLSLSEADLVLRLERHPEEAEALWRHAVPPETWLFRQVQAFEALRRWMGGHVGQSLRLASLGCATGAEALSMAAVAASLGRDRSSTRILAVDRNAEALARARSGCVSPLGQRSPLPAWAQDWFEAMPDGTLRLRIEAQTMIEWIEADLLDASDAPPCDAVMCRNVAIYLDRASRTRLRERLAEGVRDGGLLFIGHADPREIWQGAFRWIEAPGAFMLERTAAPVPLADSHGTRSVKSEAPSRGRTLTDLRALADHGSPEAAHDGLTAWTAEHPMDAEGWWLRAAIELATRRHEDARRSLDRVLYLDPMHTLALLQASALAEARGDRTEADRLRLRAGRAGMRERGA